MSFKELIKEASRKTNGAKTNEEKWVGEFSKRVPWRKITVR
jgi:hypothetical protein